MPHDHLRDARHKLEVLNVAETASPHGFAHAAGGQLWILWVHDRIGEYPQRSRKWPRPFVMDHEVVDHERASGCQCCDGAVNQWLNVKLGDGVEQVAALVKGPDIQSEGHRARCAASLSTAWSAEKIDQRRAIFFVDRRSG